MKGKAISYSDAEMRWLEENRMMVISDYHTAFIDAFDRRDVKAANLHALRKRMGWKVGRNGRFVKGQPAVNKGKPMSEATRAKCLPTTFKQGSVPANRLPLWSERVGKDGYIEMKVPLTNPYTGRPTRFMHKHRYLWEQVNGPLANGMALKCLDGDRTNCAPYNWEAIPRAMLPRLNNRHGRRYDDAPIEVKPTLMLVAKVEHKASEISKGGK